jgi:hypothetical protein
MTNFYGQGAQSTDKNYRVQDVKKLGHLLVRLGFGLLFFYILTMIYLHGRPFNVVVDGVLQPSSDAWSFWAGLLLPITTLLAVRNFFRLLANWSGVTVDFNQNEISYPGSGVIRNKFSDLFS